MNTLSIAKREVEEYINEYCNPEGRVSGSQILELEVEDKYLEVAFSYCGSYKREGSGSYDIPDSYSMDIDYDGTAYLYNEYGDLESTNPFNGSIN